MRFDRLSKLYFEYSSWLSAQAPLHQQDSPRVPAPAAFEWSKIATSKHLEWHTCYSDFKCARLQVPMDWQGTSEEASKTVDLALIKVEAKVPVTDSTYGGAVVLNPGGPGGSGVGQVLRGGYAVRTLLSAGPDSGNNTARHFDIIGFDPRGVNNSRPTLNCFPDELEAARWSIEESAHGLMDSSDTSFDYLWASKRAVAEGCSKRIAEEGIAKHMSTAPVARDIIEIFEQHGEWREKEALWLLSTSPVLHTPSDTDAAETERDAAKTLLRTAYEPGKEMVQYWGFSYGSILGATLSAMYPDRIERAVLDGVANSHDYMAGGWTTNLQDTDLLFVKMAEYCYEGGPEQCALYDPDGPAVIAANLGIAVAKLKDSPMAIPGTDTAGPRVVTYGDLKLHLSGIVYNPLLHFPLTAQILHELSSGSGESLAAWKAEGQPPLGRPLSKKCLEDGPYSPSCFGDAKEKNQDVAAAILCSDGLPRLNQSKKEYREYASTIMAQSQLLGAAWAEIQMPCTAWHTRPHWRYEGDFRNKTAHPILFAGNTIDPVTPLRNAFTMASRFKGAGVLHLNSEGHCTYATTSLCAGRAIREYFQSGKLPGEEGELEDLDDWNGYGGLCETNRLPFDGYSKGVVPALPKGETDEELWKALVHLNQNWP